ncbi:major capsid family protein, partial [Xenorhabdus bovienii]
QEEKNIRFPMVPLLNTPLEYRGLHQLTTYYGKLGQVEVPYANTIAYLDIPAA